MISTVTFFPCRRRGRRLEDRARLHLRDLRIRDPEAAAAVAKHRVRFDERVDQPLELVGRHLGMLGERGDLAWVWAGTREAGIEQPDRDRQPIHHFEDPSKSPR